MTPARKMKAPTKTEVSRALAEQIDAHLKCFERDPKINPGKRYDEKRKKWVPDARGVRDYFGAGARGDRHRVWVIIEDDRSDSVIVAATNHEHMLDGAIFRRFDEAIAFGSPARDEVVALVRRSLPDVAASPLDFDAIYAAVANSRLGHADVCVVLDRVRKDHVLVAAPIDTARIVEATVRRSRATSAEAFS